MEESHSSKAGEELGRDLPLTPEESFVMAVYSSMDKAIAGRLELLRVEDGLIPACKIGCSHCCRFHILINIAEARTLAQFVRRNFSPKQFDSLRMRTEQWHEWDNAMRWRYSLHSTAQRSELSIYDPCCPLLVDGACSAYDVRPTACRAHFVSSNPFYCHAANDPASSEARPSVIASLATSASTFSMAMRTLVEKTGIDYSRTTTLLPHGLAIEMDWDFAKGQ